MPWVRIGDTAHSHPKMVRAHDRFGPERALAVWGFTVACASWSGEHTLDGWVSEAQARRLSSPDLVRQLVKDAQWAGFFIRGGRVRGPDGDWGWLVDNTDDELLHIRTAKEIELDRGRDAATRLVGPKRLVRLRDGDQCRYCAKTVSWTDRRSARGGTYDHPDPADRETFVVACFGCNRTKSNRTVEQWVAAGGHPLGPAPDEPLIGDTTAEQFGVPQSHAPAYARPGTPPDTAHARPGSQPDTAPQDDTAAAPAATTVPADADGPTGPDLTYGGVAVLPRPGQVGPGRARSGLDAGTAAQPRDGPPAQPSPARRRRARRSKQARAP